MRVETFNHGYAYCCSSTDVTVNRDFGIDIKLIVADPPYGNVVNEKWDHADDEDKFVEWMLDWTNTWSPVLVPGGAFYVWGGIGKPGFRPFFSYLSRVEKETDLKLHNLVTWGKKRGYGVQDNYLFTREECAVLVKGDKPSTFNVPYLKEKRGYPGFNKKYPAKSEYKRRTNVWTDVTEMLRNKSHRTQKAQRVIEIPIEVHTNEGDYVIDPFAGSGTTALAAIALKRKFLVYESNPEIFETLCKRIRAKDKTEGVK